MSKITSQAFKETENPLYWISLNAFSSEAKEVLEKFLAYSEHKSYLSYSFTTDIQRFSNLAATWKEDTKFKSSLAEIVLHPSYQQIIGMGISVVPMILHQLREEPDHWFWALRAITGVNPIKVEDKGRIDKMAKSWLNWGEKNELV